MIINLSSGGSVAVPRFQFTTADMGQQTFSFDESSETSSLDGVYALYVGQTGWEFYMFRSGTLTMLEATVCDLFMCSKGERGDGGHVGVSSRTTETGETYYMCTGSVSPGFGGKGGKRVTKTGILLVDSCEVVINNGNNSLYPQPTQEVAAQIGSYSSNDDGYEQSDAGADGGYCFNDSSAYGPDGNGRKVGAGGGTGGWSLNGSGSQPTSGGSYGGAHGGYAHSVSRSDGTFWGAGGGGGGAWGNTTYASTSRYDVAYGSSGGYGYAGFVGIRG